MELFKGRWLAAMCAVFLATSAAVAAAGGMVKLALAATAALFLFVFLVYAKLADGSKAAYIAKKYKRRIAAGTAAFLLAIFSSYYFFNIKYAGVRELDGKCAVIKATVLDVIYESGYGGYYIVNIKEMNGEPVKLRAKLDVGFAAALDVGDVFTSEVTYRALDSEGSFDEESYYLARGVLTSAEVSGNDLFSVLSDEKSHSITVALSRLRSRVAATVGVMTEDGYGIAEAVFTGIRSSMDPAAYRDFKYIGAAHLLAVSGQHFSIIIGGLEVLLRRARLPRAARIVLLIAASLFYMGLTGFSSTVLRAGIMMILYLASYFFRREPDSVTSLFLSVTIITIFSPASIFDAALLLSFSAMLGCLATRMFVRGALARVLSAENEDSTVMRVCRSICRAAYMSAVLSLMCSLFTLPVMWLYIGQTSILSPVSTLILTLPVTIILYLCPIIVLTSTVVPTFCLLLGYICTVLSKFCVFVASNLARIPNASFSLAGVLPAVGCIIVAVLLVASLLCKKTKARLLIASAATVFVVLYVGVMVYAAASNAPYVSYINSKKNDGFIVMSGRSALICDVSDGSYTVTREALYEAKKRGAVKVSALMLTHLHQRHVRTFSKLATEEYVDELWLPAPGSEDEEYIYDSLSGVAEKLGVDIVTYGRDDNVTLSFENVDITVAGRTSISRSSHTVIALSFEYKAQGGDVWRTVYAGSSVHESDAYEYMNSLCTLPDTKNVIIGIHGPVYKSGAKYDVNEGAVVTYANEDVKLLFDEYMTGVKSIIYGSGKIEN